jgi:hypothetical protein
VESFFGKGKEESLAAGVPAKEQEQARPPTQQIEEQLDQGLAGLDKRLALQESLDAQLANLDVRMEVAARAQQEKELSPELSQGKESQQLDRDNEIQIDRGFGISR